MVESSQSLELLESLGLIAPSTRPPVPGDGPQTTAGVLAPALAATPDAPALIGASGRYTFAELDREVDRAANALRALGVVAGDRVAVCLPNDVDIVVHFLASQRLAAMWVGIQRPLAPKEKAYMLADCGARLFVADPETLVPVLALGAALPELEHTLSLEDWRERVRAASSQRVGVGVAVDPFAPAAIAYTSGTSGRPKGAVHSQHNLLLAAAMLVLTGAQPHVRVGVVLSLTLLNMIVRAVLSAYYGGRTLVCIERHDPAAIAAWVKREQIGSLDLVPALVRDLLSSPDVGDDLASLEDIVSGGGACPPDVLELYRKRFGRGVAVGYGMTEAPTGVARSRGEPAPAPGYCGVAIAQVELRVVDEHGDVLPPGEVGELCVAPATTGEYAGCYTPMLGYWGKPEATREALRDGCYHTGDLGLIDEAGRVFIRGRRSELIVRGGSNVYPAEVERVLEEHPEVAGAAVLGVDDERLGERVVAAVERVAGARVDAEALRRHAAESLARYKVPDRIAIVEALPRNALHKVLKRELKPLFEDS
ncbi:MAG: AMP-binding protein [Myxococcota bacterium]|nr:AMP-binding protein [Myxococcota bacterium]